MKEHKFVDPKHQQLRSVLRFIGISMAGIGLVLTLVGFIDFFRSANSFAPPRYFWCAFAGLPLLGVGLMISSVAFMGAVTRFQAKEVTPVAKEAFNYLAAETDGAIRGIAHAVAQGIDAKGEEAVLCSNCGTSNPDMSAFCKKCGTRLINEKRCGKCGRVNMQDANFCNGCGNKLE